MACQKTNYNLCQIYRTYVEWKQGINISYLNKNLQTLRLLKTIHIELLRLTKSLWVFQINQRHKRQNNIINLYQDITLIYSILSFLYIAIYHLSFLLDYKGALSILSIILNSKRKLLQSYKMKYGILLYINTTSVLDLAYKIC